MHCKSQLVARLFTKYVLCSMTWKWASYAPSMYVCVNIAYWCPILSQKFHQKTNANIILQLIGDMGQRRK